MILFEMDPLTRPVAIAEMLILLAGAAAIGWLIGRMMTTGKIDRLREKLTADEFELEDHEAKARKVGIAKIYSAMNDNLKLIEGIGPQIEQLLKENGICSFAQLADKAPDEIYDVLYEGGSTFRIHNPGSWPQQAALARDGRWEELKLLQDRLNGGRY